MEFINVPTILGYITKYMTENGQISEAHQLTTEALTKYPTCTKLLDTSTILYTRLNQYEEAAILLFDMLESLPEREKMKFSQRVTLLLQTSFIPI